MLLECIITYFLQKNLGKLKTAHEGLQSRLPGGTLLICVQKNTHAAKILMQEVSSLSAERTFFSVAALSDFIQ